MSERIFAWKFFSGKVIGYFLILLVVLLLGFFAFIQLKNVYNRLTSNWNEFAFTYNHPSIVKTIETDFASRSAALENYYTQPKPEEQLTQLIQSITAQFKK